MTTPPAPSTPTPDPLSGCSAWAGYDDIAPSAVELHSPLAWCGYLAMATDILWAATGRRWRGETRTDVAVLRAAPPAPGEPGWPYEASWGRCGCYGGPGPAGPIWFDITGRAAHAAPFAVRLPRRDVTTVLNVQIDAATFTGWRLDGSWLARTDGRGWPMCHERAVVTYQYGRPAPVTGRTVCAELATELGRAGASNPDRPCSLPKRLQSVTRQGITFAALDNLDFLDKGLTGLLSVDLWIKSVNPKGRAQEATVWSPDLPYARRTS